MPHRRCKHDESVVGLHDAGVAPDRSRDLERFRAFAEPLSGNGLAFCCNNRPHTGALRSTLWQSPGDIVFVAKAWTAHTALRWK